MDAFITDRYIRKGRPGVGGTRIVGLNRYFFTLSNAFWQSSFLVSIFYEKGGVFFLSSLKIGSQMGVSWAMNPLMYCSLPQKALISFSVFGTGMSIIALAFVDFDFSSADNEPE